MVSKPTPDSNQRYGKWVIYYDPPPIPIRSSDYHFTHDDYDGAEDGGDRRFGHGSSVEDCKAQILDIEVNLLLSGVTSCPRCGLEFKTLLHRFCQHEGCPCPHARAAIATQE